MKFGKNVFYSHKFKPFELFLLLQFIVISTPVKSQITNFPITEYKATNPNSSQIFYISGDGGMNDFSKTLCSKFADQGYSVIAFDAKKYFWNQKTPETFVKDLSAIISYYQQLEKSNAFILLGYSFGADVTAFIPGRLSADLAKKMQKAVFLNPSSTTDFEIKLMDMLGKNPENRKYNTFAELNSIQHMPIVCLISEDEFAALSAKIHNTQLTIQTLPGDHRFNRDVGLIVNTIVALL